MKFKISNEIKNRCMLKENFTIDPKIYQHITLDCLEFFKYNGINRDQIALYIYLKKDSLLIEYIKEKEITKELVDDIILFHNSLGVNEVEIYIKKTDLPKLNQFIYGVKEQKIKQLSNSYKDLDIKTLNTFLNLNKALDLLDQSGINQNSISEIEKKINVMMLSIIDNENSFYTLTKSFMIDETLYEHSTSVAMFSYILASALNKYEKYNFSKKELSVICFCGCCHDVGKTCVPSEILNKPSALTEEEFKEMKNHARYGFNLLLEAEKNGAIFPIETKKVAIEHHEKMKGGGYPKNLSGALENGGDIHIYSRIVSICDVYSALLMKRVYKNPFSASEIYKIMYSMAETSFDLDIYKIFLTDVFKYNSKKYSNFNQGGRIILAESLKKAR